MATNRPLSYHHYYQIFSKFRSKSSDSLTTKKSESKMKKSQTALSNIESKSSSILRRRLGFFRLKRSSNSNVQALQQIIDQLKTDLQTKTNELQHQRNQSIEQAMQLQTMLNVKLDEMLTENDLLKKSIEELESFAQQQQKTPNSPVSNALLTTAFPETNNSIIKSTNFTGSIPTTRSEVRHKSEIEIELKPDKQQQQPQIKKPLSPISTSSYPPIIRSTGTTNKRIPTVLVDENSFSSPYQTPKRRFLTNSIQTQTPTLPSEQQTDDKVQTLVHELNDCQAIIKQQEQQLVNGKKDRDQLCFIVDERANELHNLKQKNEQLEQMIRNEREYNNDERKFLQQQQPTYERIQNLEEQLKQYESDATKMRDHILCSKIKLDKKTDENQCLVNELSDMKKFNESLEQENQKLKTQIEYERKKNEENLNLKASVDLELEKTLDKLRTQRYEHETKLSNLDETLKSSQKQYQFLQQNQRSMEDKHHKEIGELKQHIHQLEIKIEEVIKDKALVSIRCGELIEENRRLEKVLNDKEDLYEEKISGYKEKNSSLSIQIDELEKRLNETKKQLELITIEKDETLADMLVAVRVASELRYDAEDRLNKANDDLKRVTEHIEQERVHRRQMHLPPCNRKSNGDLGQVRIKEMIRTLEANNRNHSINNHHRHAEPMIRQRPLSQPCTRTETNILLTHHHHRQFGTTTDDAKILSSTKNDSPPLNNTHRSDTSVRSITNEQYDEMKSIVEAVFARMPGSVCKRDALLKWCVEKLARYGISITNFSNSWTDGIAFCALLHSYLPDRIDLEMIKKESKKKRFEIAFNIANSLGIVSILDIDEMCSSEWPDWERVMYYVALIFRHFEVSTPNETISPILPIPQATSSPISPTLSSSLCASLRTTNSIPTILCSPLQTV